jgi:hypothetical protein
MRTFHNPVTIEKCQISMVFQPTANFDYSLKTNLKFGNFILCLQSYSIKLICKVQLTKTNLQNITYKTSLKITYRAEKRILLFKLNVVCWTKKFDFESSDSSKLTEPS